MDVSLESVIAAVSLVVSVVVAFFFVRDRRHAKFELENDYAVRLMDWHGEVVNVLLQARCVDRAEPSLGDLRARLSALIEQGRFFFPNIDKGDGHGDDKPPAYRGYRNLGLDFLVASYNLLQQVPTESDREKLEILQRHFTSIVFEIVRPAHRLAVVRSLTDRYFVQDKCGEDFLDHNDSFVFEDIWKTPAKGPAAGE
ncbi:MAG: hypothetical protein AAF481_10580 [Acidobacteriota bacterium]